MHLLPKLYAMPRSWLSFLVFFISMLSASGQTFNLSVDREPLEKVFLLIEKQSDYSFIYTRETLAKTKPVTFTVRNETLERVLNRCFDNQPLTYLVDDKHIVVKQEVVKSAAVPLQNITGRVRNEIGEPVAGVTVTIRGGGRSTATDVNGNFALEGSPLNAVLVISGAEIETQELVIKSSAEISIVVKARINVLDETMVIAYGKTTRRYATGTLSKVKAEEIARQPVSNPLSALSGRVSGLQIRQVSGAPGTGITVQIRGRNSIDNGIEPLYLVDGIPYPSGTHTGDFGGGANSYLSPLDNINPADIESIEVLKDADVTAIYGSRGANGVILITTKKGIAGKTHGSLKVYSGAGAATRKLKLLNTGEYLAMRREAFKNDNVAPSMGNAPDLLRWDTTRFTDWQDLLIGNTMRASEVTGTLSGGTEQTQFLLSSTYRKETTVFPGSFGAQKISGSGSINHRSADKKFTVGFSTTFLTNDNFLPRSDLTTGLLLPPDAPVIYNSDGSLNWESSTWDNPFGAVMQTFKTKTQNLNANLNLRYRISENLEIAFTGGLGQLWVTEKFLYPASSLDPVYGPGGETAAFGTSKTTTLIGEPQISYFKKIGEHKLEFLAGATMQHTGYSGLFVVGRGYPNDESLNSLAAASTVRVNADLDTRYRYLGFFGRTGYNFRNKYLATFTIRRDGSSRYGPANRFKNFGSAGAGWIFTEEKWIGKNTVLSFGKIKASAGYAANDQIGDYKYLDLYSSYYLPYQGQSTFYPTQLFNSQFGWEKIRKLEMGIDLGFFRDRVLLSANYYYNTTTNQLVSYTLPATTGFSGVLKNLPAVIRNTGLELELSSTIIKNRNWNWNASFNITFPQNKLVSFQDFESSTYTNFYALGKPLSIARVFTNTGVDPATGLYSFYDYNKDGLINGSEDKHVILNTGQQCFGGMQQTLSYKKFTFSLVAQLAIQRTVPSFLNRFPRPGARFNQPRAVLERWKADGDYSNIQRFTAVNSDALNAYSNYLESAAAYENGSYLRLKNLYISYQIGSSKLKQAGISGLNVFAEASNLVTITKYRGLDPETLQSLPPVKVVAVGIQFTF